MEKDTIYDLEHFRLDLLSRAWEQVHNTDQGEHSEESKNEVTLDLFNVTYDICYFAAIGKPLEELVELYKEKGFEVTLDVLEEIQMKSREDIVRLKVILQLVVDSLVEKGLNYKQATSFVTEFYPSENVC